jgi:hypothetical protein
VSANCANNKVDHTPATEDVKQRPECNVTPVLRVTTGGHPIQQLSDMATPLLQASTVQLIQLWSITQVSLCCELTQPLPAGTTLHRQTLQL